MLIEAESREEELSRMEEDRLAGDGKNTNLAPLKEETPIGYERTFQNSNLLATKKIGS